MKKKIKNLKRVENSFANNNPDSYYDITMDEARKLAETDTEALLVENDIAYSVKGIVGELCDKAYATNDMNTASIHLQNAKSEALKSGAKLKLCDEWVAYNESRWIEQKLNY